MKTFSDLAMNVATSEGAEFADIRFIEENENRIYVQRNALKLLDETDSFGYGVRALVKGAWGFASSTILTEKDIVKTVKLAISAAKASSIAPNSQYSKLTKEAPVMDECLGPCLEDPFLVPNSEKAELLLSACDKILQVPNIVSAWGYLQFIKRRRIIGNTDGSFLDLVNTFSHPMLNATAVIGSESQSRSYQGGARQAGFEFIRQIDLLSMAPELAQQAVIKCQADESPVGVMDLVLDPEHLALTMHESVGHPTELDRILGWEANMAGRSFVKPEDIDNLQYGSELVNFTADGHLEGGLASWFYDDDGVKMQKFKMIERGKLVNLGMTRETAGLIGYQHSNGCCRASKFNNVPINRIPNLYMEPGSDDQMTPERLMAGIDKGIFIEGRGSFSIDQMRNNFQFGGDFFWLIEGGKKTKPLKKVTYQAQTKQFWGSCDGVAGRSSWRAHGLMNCGKGEPMQANIMTHGASHCRFRNIEVGG